MVSTVRSANDYLDRGLRRVVTYLPVHDVVALDRRVAEIPFRSRNSVIIEAIRHFFGCPSANWEAGDHDAPSKARSATGQRVTCDRGPTLEQKTVGSLSGVVPSVSDETDPLPQPVSDPTLLNLPCRDG